MAKNDTKLTVETLTHNEATRKNIPTAEYQSVMVKEQQAPFRVTFERKPEPSGRRADPR